MTRSIDARELVRMPIMVPSPLQRYMPGSYRTRLEDGIFLVALGGNNAEENTAFVYSRIAPEQVLDLAADFFGEDEFSIVVESDTNDELIAYLDANAWTIDEDEPAMLLHPIPDPPDLASPLEIRTVTTQQRYDDFMRISETGHRWVPSLEAATDPNVCLLVGYLQGQAIATARINCLGEVGEINGVVTNPEFRRRGFGTAMTWAAIEQGRLRGCQSITLSASEMGYPVYLRMGFEPVCSYRTYMPPHVNRTSEGPAHAQRDS